MKIFLCILISEKNQRFLSLLLKSLNSLKRNLNYNLNIIFIIQKKNVLFEKFVKKKLSKNVKYKIIKSCASPRNIIPKIAKRIKIVNSYILICSERK